MSEVRQRKPTRKLSPSSTPSAASDEQESAAGGILRCPEGFDRNKPFECNICNPAKMLKNWVSFTNHMRSHPGDKVDFGTVLTDSEGDDEKEAATSGK